MENIFLGFLNRSITAGWLILAVIALRMLLKRAPKWIHCLLWALVAFRLVCPFSLESVFSLIPSRETVRRDVAAAGGAYIDSGVEFVDDAVNPVLRRSFAPAPVAEARVRDASGPSLMAVAGVIWMAGLGALLAYALAGSIRLWLRVGTAVRVEPEIGGGLGRQGIVMESEFVDMPFIFGVLRPRIYLPTGMPEEMRRPVVAHEMAHLQRRDNLWKLLAYGLLAAYWFHPLCWAAYVLFCRDMELACDERVIRDYDVHQKRMYSEALLACSLDRRAGLACPLAFGEVGVKERIRSVLNYKRPAFWAIAAAVAACVAAAVCFLTDPVKEEESSRAAALAGADSGNGSVRGDGEGGIVAAGGAGNGKETADGGNGSGREAGGIVDADNGKETADGGNGTGTDGTDGSGSSEEESAGREGSSDGAEASGTGSDNGTGTLAPDDGADVVSRFMEMDWEEIRSRNLPVVEERAPWTDVVCIAEIPEERIRIYGYNDAEIDGRGVAVEIGDEVDYFDWNYVSMTSTHYQAPQCYWNRTKRQLQVALNIYMGPRCNAQVLHVLQYHDTGAPTDNVLVSGWGDPLVAMGWGDMLEERIDFRFVEETGQLTLFDTGNQEELVSVTVEEGPVTGLELGNLSRFLLGEEIVLQLNPGYWVEGGFAAEYSDDMPLLEAELLYEDNGGEMTFSLGEIRSNRADTW